MISNFQIYKGQDFVCYINIYADEADDEFTGSESKRLFSFWLGAEADKKLPLRPDPFPEIEDSYGVGTYWSRLKIKEGKIINYREGISIHYTDCDKAVYYIDYKYFKLTRALTGSDSVRSISFYLGEEGEVSDEKA